MPFDAFQVLKMFKTPPFRGFFVESWILVKMDQFWNCNYGSPFPSNTQVLHHFGKPQGSPLRWSNQFLMVASILGAISPWLCGIGVPIPKKSVLIWIFSSGYLTRLNLIKVNHIKSKAYAFKDYNCPKIRTLNISWTCKAPKCVHCLLYTSDAADE